MECMVCQEERRVEVLPCGDICRLCLAGFLTAEVQKISFAPGQKIACPLCSDGDEVRHYNSYEFYRKRLGDEQQQAVDKVLTVKLLQLSEDVMPCPGSACKSYFVRGELLCDTACPDCGQVVKSERPALERLVASVSDQASGMVKELLSQPCPSCETPIIRSFGCPHMTCEVCRA